MSDPVANTNNPTWLRSRLVLVESALRRVLMALPNQTQYPNAELDGSVDEAAVLLFNEQPADRPHGGIGDNKCGCDQCEAWDWNQNIENRRYASSPVKAVRETNERIASYTSHRAPCEGENGYCDCGLTTLLEELYVQPRKSAA